MSIKDDIGSQMKGKTLTRYKNSGSSSKRRITQLGGKEKKKIHLKIKVLPVRHAVTLEGCVKIGTPVTPGTPRNTVSEGDWKKPFW